MGLVDVEGEMGGAEAFGGGGEVEVAGGGGAAEYGGCRSAEKVHFGIVEREERGGVTVGHLL